MLAVNSQHTIQTLCSHNRNVASSSQPPLQEWEGPACTSQPTWNRFAFSSSGRELRSASSRAAFRCSPHPQAPPTPLDLGQMLCSLLISPPIRIPGLQASHMWFRNLTFFLRLTKAC